MRFQLFFLLLLLYFGRNGNTQFNAEWLQQLNNTNASSLLLQFLCWSLLVKVNDALFLSSISVCYFFLLVFFLLFVSSLFESHTRNIQMWHGMCNVCSRERTIWMCTRSDFVHVWRRCFCCLFVFFSSFCLYNLFLFGLFGQRCVYAHRRILHIMNTNHILNMINVVVCRVTGILAVISHQIVFFLYSFENRIWFLFQVNNVFQMSIKQFYAKRIASCQLFLCLCFFVRSIKWQPVFHWFFIYWIHTFVLHTRLLKKIGMNEWGKQWISRLDLN